MSWRRSIKSAIKSCKVKEGFYFCLTFSKFAFKGTKGQDKHDRSCSTQRPNTKYQTKTKISFSWTFCRQRQRFNDKCRNSDFSVVSCSAWFFWVFTFFFTRTFFLLLILFFLLLPFLDKNIFYHLSHPYLPFLFPAYI